MTQDTVRILLIEDSAEDAEIFRRFLWKPARPDPRVTYRIEWVTRLDKGISMHDDSFDIVFLDLNLPGSTGIETMARVAEEIRGTPIVVLTTSTSDSLGTRAIQLGAQDYLEKDQLAAAPLRRVIEYSIERYRLLEEKNRLIRELTEAREAISELREIIPICSYCKNIRNDSGYWEQVESYLHKYTEAALSHGICPDCAKKLGI